MVRRIVLLLLLGLLALLAEASLYRIANPGAFRPDLILILVVVLALRGDPFEGSVLAFLLGMLGDLFTGGPSGLGPLLSETSFLLSLALARRLFVGNPLSRFTFVLVILLVRGTIEMFFLRVYGPPAEFLLLHVKSLIPAGIATSVFFVLLYAPSARILERLRMAAPSPDGGSSGRW